MEEQAIYKDEFLIETKQMIEKILLDRNCTLVVSGEFVGNEIKSYIKIKKLDLANDTNN